MPIEDLTLHEIVTLEQLADRLNLEIRLYRTPNQNTETGDWGGAVHAWHAHFDGCAVRLVDGRPFVWLFGQGSNPHDVLANYARGISGKTLIVMKLRREVPLPKIITAQGAHDEKTA